MRRFATALLFLGLLFGHLPASASSLTVVADEWPPYSGEALPSKGLSLDVIRSVLERAGYQVEVAVIPWARIMDGARKGSFDVVGSLFLTENLKPHVTYSEPYYTTEVNFLRRVGARQTFAKPNDLRPFSIAVGDGFHHSEEFDSADYLNKVVVTTTLQSVQMVAHGRVELTLDSAEVIHHALEREDPSLQGMVEFLPKPLASRGIHMAVRNDLPMRDKVIADFNRMLGEMRKDGSFAALLANHSLGTQ